MSYAALLFALAAFILFVIEAYRAKSLVALGLAVFIVCFCVTFIVQGAPSWVIH